MPANFVLPESNSPLSVAGSGDGLGGFQMGNLPSYDQYLQTGSFGAGGGFDMQALQKALSGLGGGGGTTPQQPKPNYDMSLIQPQMLDPVMKQRALVQALLGSGNG